jgi:PAS domain S-box-containing protein
MSDKGTTYQFSEAHYRLAMEAAGVGMWDWDLLIGQQVWSRECKVMANLPLDDATISYEQFLSLIFPEDRPNFEKVVSNNLRNGTELGVEFRVVWSNGSLHWIYAKGRGIYDATGKPVRMIGVAFDITARKEAEEMQKQADWRLREILNSIGDAFVHLDREWRFTYVNAQAEHLWKAFSNEELRGRILWELYPEIIGTETDHYLHQAMETRQPVAFEAYYPEIQRWYDIRVYPAENGGLTELLTDITERKFLQQERDHLLALERASRRESEAARKRSNELVVALERKQAFFQAVVKQAPSGLIIAEAPRGNILLYNEEAIRLMGPEMLEIQDYREYERQGALHADGTRYSAEEYPLAQALLAGETLNQEHMLYQRSDGSRVHLSISAAPIRDAQGRMLAAIVAFNDISGRYELERRKDEFICIASHELRTPLTSLKGNLQLSERYLRRFLTREERSLSARERELAEHLTAWNERALRQVDIESRLTNDLLEATNIQTGKLHVSLEPGDLLHIVRNTVSDMRVVAPSRAIHLELPKQSTIPVMVDQVRISQVITNYLTNALKYSAEPLPVIVGITLAENEARVWVRDAGSGLSLEAQRSIWDRFRQAYSFATYTGMNGSGLGLGLYISQALIQQHGGRTGVESAPGMGSTFWFSLPLATHS